MNKIKYIDTYCYGTFHEMFNACLLLLCTYVTNQVHYIADRHTIQNILSLTQIQPQAIKTTTIRIPAHYDKPLSTLLRYLLGTILNLWQIIITPKHIPIIFNYNNAFALAAINRLCKLLNRQVIIFCHGELELLSPYSKEHMGPIARMIRNRLQSFLVRKRTGFAPSLRLIVLGDSILTHLQKYLSPEAKKLFYSMDHPYLFPTSHQEKTHTTVPHQMTVGTIGTMKKAKGLDNFLRFIADKPSSIQVQVIGRIDDLSEQKISSLDISIAARGNSFIPRDTLIKLTQQLDYVLFFYYPDSYQLLASGAIFDAIVAGRPIIALQNDYFSYLFQKYGDFGYLETSPEQMVKRMEHILENGDERYTEFTQHLQQLKQKLHPIGLLHSFKTLLDITQ